MIQKFGMMKLYMLWTIASTVSINSDKKVRYKIDCHTLHKVLLVVILLFIIAIICQYYPKHR